jgi:ribosome biogenesis GTPase
MAHSLQALGWSAGFSAQLTPEESEALTPARITAVHRNGFTALSETGTQKLFARENADTDTVTVGDWVLAEPDGMIARRLARHSTLARRAAGEDARKQLIAANVDVLFIVTSCNDDFNPARLERYLVLASTAGCRAVIVLTKPDMCGSPGTYIAKARTLAPDLPVIAINAHDPDQAAQLQKWWGKGETAALLGSSGVGKSTLTATLTGIDVATGDIREDDAKGRHTTTARNLYPSLHGGWLLDTPGMRALRLNDAATGIDSVFADLATLAAQCKFRDCAHLSEPGCAIRAGIKQGNVDPDRLRRWQKLTTEDIRNNETIATTLARGTASGKPVNPSRNRVKSGNRKKPRR